MSSLSLKTTEVPHGSFFGGARNSTPRALSVSYVPSTSSAHSESGTNVPIRSSWPGGVKRVMRVSAPGMRSSIQRWPPGPIAWSVAITKPSFSV